MAIFILVILLTTLAELRDKPDPEKRIPLHPSTLIVPVGSALLTASK
jgi:hypothetical protein